MAQSNIIDMDIQNAIERVNEASYRGYLEKFRREYPDCRILVTEREDRFELVVIRPTEDGMTGGAEQYFMDKASGEVTMGWHEHPMEVPLVEPAPERPVQEPLPPSAQTAVKAHNAFGLDLYHRFTKKGKNLFFSPYSIFNVLVVGFEGARGKTAEEMQKVLHLPENTQAFAPAFRTILQHLQPADSLYTLLTANAFWIQQKYPVVESYLERMKAFYGGEIRQLNFGAAPEKSRQTINTWVEEKTNGRIKNLISPRSITPLTRMVITSAIYFRAKWAKEFLEGNTQKAPFYLSSGRSVDVQMMFRQVFFNYGETERFQILEMDYTGNEISMFILLPRKEHLDEVEQMIDVERLAEWENAMKREEVRVFIPRFHLELKYNLSKVLKQMGMRTVFQYPEADLTGISPTKELYFEQIVHQSYVDVAEYGTEAAAATAGIMEGSTAVREPREPKIFRADHPFLFWIQHKNTGIILFMGKVEYPEKKK